LYEHQESYLLQNLLKEALVEDSAAPDADTELLQKLRLLNSINLKPQ